MALKNYYELLEIIPTASSDEVKRAFRGQIAKYHPDKVHHLGKEFQAMAADRAAELTEAYRILSDEGRRAEYDRAFAESGGAVAVWTVDDAVGIAWCKYCKPDSIFTNRPVEVGAALRS